jgi:hypothetical protein
MLQSRAFIQVLEVHDFSPLDDSDDEAPGWQSPGSSDPDNDGSSLCVWCDRRGRLVAVTADNGWRRGLVIVMLDLLPSGGSLLLDQEGGCDRTHTKKAGVCLPRSYRKIPDEARIHEHKHKHTIS